MKSNRFLLLCLLFAAFYSCKKDSTEVRYPAVYHKTGVNAVSDLRLFSSNGEITDPMLISIFNQLDTISFGYYVTALSDHYRMDSVILDDPQRAIIRNNFEWKNCFTNRSGNRLILTTTEILTGFSAGDEFTRKPEYYIGDARPEVLSEYVISSTRGSYSFGYTGRETFLFDYYGSRLFAPMIIFNQRTQNGQGISFINNVLREDFYRSMQPGDTISLIKCQLLYEK